MNKFLLVALLLFLNLSAQAGVTGKADVSLTQINSFGANPGDLKMYFYAPKNVVEKAPLVVILHGCAQSAAEFDDEIGFTKLADENKFYLLLPQQKESNNEWRCFNWFNQEDTTRGKGEAASIVEMVEFMQKEYAIDGRRVFILGLSAGAAMSNVMMANYPEVFSAGALVAGIPFGCAKDGSAAWSCMYGASYPVPTAQQRGDFVRAAIGSYNGPLPRVMVVHGSSDEFVSPKNAQFNVDQWTNVHGIDNVADAESKLDNQQYFEHKKGSQTVVSFLSIRGQKHGFPVDSKKGCGEAGKFILDSGVCAAKHISSFFKILK
jgi:poly(hydroxyalkanoate) depolymerase family esterase